MNQRGNIEIKIKDKYFNERVLERFREVLNLPNEIFKLESDDD
jgi:hypothetical protein